MSDARTATAARFAIRIEPAPANPAVEANQQPNQQ